MEHLLNTAPHGGHPDAEEGHEVMPAAQALALSDLHETGVAASDDVPLLGNVNPLHRVKAQLTVCVGTATITVGELMAAKAQQVLRLDSKVAHPVDLLLEGNVVARGHLVAVDEHFGVRITELPVDLKL
ncbi:flagellar motor switch protein FliN (plasmid) [Ralstonia solanacearum]|nr:flagellar motor switch protein FliN [Ralstonia solanacearum]BCL99350.1 flagellar motor switch protein FliN [Ralstonia solanacearum]BCM14827.1 flagellar motor switch protein FliN [Ralstonia solanacearum]BCN06766.1 flagellar motor switch protein FliN [Ralstonia solanacearum]BCN11931.1 flagellar motor switch protein FliN [Ralstonia solanacearum]